MIQCLMMRLSKKKEDYAVLLMYNMRLSVLRESDGTLFLNIFIIKHNYLRLPYKSKPFYKNNKNNLFHRRNNKMKIKITRAIIYILVFHSAVHGHECGNLCTVFDLEGLALL